ncbi:hypothetical protein SLS55_010337 [Diplodia seriata]|uniref:Involucrin repeat protein n=1 Tax=Diplodia seriata TaxID=420778 RepID=A0ABR3BY89_9PEZI
MADPQKPLPNGTKAPTNNIDAAHTARSDQPATQAAKDLINAAKLFVAEPSFQYTSGLLDEIGQLRQQLQEREQELLQKTNDNESCLRLFRQEATRRDREIVARGDVIASLQSNIQKLEKKIDKHGSTESQLLKKCQDVMDLLNTERETSKACHESLSALENQLADQVQQTEDINAHFEQAEDAKKRAEYSLKRKNKAYADLEKQLIRAEDELRHLQQLGVELVDETLDETISTLGGLWKPAIELISSQLGEDLDKVTLEYTYAWTKLDSRFGSTPIPRSNSYTAKVIRIAAALSILANLVDALIFQPTYHLPPNSGIRELLFDCASVKQEREALLRSMLLALPNEEQESEKARRIDEVSTELMSHIQDLILVGQRTTFRAELEQVISTMQMKWERVQHIERVVEPIFDLGFSSDFQCQSLEPSLPGPESGKSIDHSVSLGNEEVQCLVLPGIFTIEGGAVMQIVPGTALSVAEAMKAEEEIVDQRAVSSQRIASSRRRLSLHSQRPSSLQGGRLTRSATLQGNPFLGQFHF